jgi:IS30 family transposase
MPPQRTSLGSISGNSRRGKELTPYMRRKIASKASEGVKLAAIAIELKIPRKTIEYTLQQDELRDDGYSLPRKAHKKSYTDAQERRIIRHVWIYPKDTYQNVINACELGYKRSIVKKILKRHGILN